MEFIKGDHRFYQEDDDGKLLAEITWKPISDKVVEVDHTYVDESLRGQGLAEELVDRLVVEMKVDGKMMVPVCPYVIDLFERKKEKYGHIAK